MLSVIVPVYNAKEYIEKCVESLIRLHLGDYEIVLADDGSTDGSGDICDEYAGRHPDISVIHLKHAGLAEARVQGIGASEGEYITFVDSDDFVDAGIYSSLIEAMEKESDIDIAVAGMDRCYPDGTTEELFDGSGSTGGAVFCREDAVREMISNRLFGWHLCGKVYRRKLFEGFDPDREITTGEDLVSNWELFNKAKRVYYNPEYCYHYMLHTGSMTESERQYERYKSDWRAYKNVLSDTHMRDTYVEDRILEHAISALTNLIREMLLEGERAEDGELLRYVKDIENCLSRINSEESFDRWLLNKGNEIIHGYMAYAELVENTLQGIKNRIGQSAMHYRYIFIYGTGLIARHVARIIMMNFSGYTGHIISDGQHNHGEFMYHPVAFISSVEVNNEANCFILAVNESTQDIIEKDLISRGHGNIIRLEVNSIF